MSSLMGIQSNCQKTAEAISAAINLSVEISDNNSICVAGTGEFRKFINKKIQGYVHHRVLNTGKVFIVENPGHHELCTPCPQLNKCYATAEICVPIINEEIPVGVIGLVSLDEEQQCRILSNQKQYTGFAEKMAELLASKSKEIEMMNKQNFLNLQLSKIINFVDQGAIATDEYGIITHVNKYAMDILKNSSIVGQPLLSALPVDQIKKSLLTNKYFTNEEIILSKPNLAVMGDIYPIKLDDDSKGIVFIFRGISDAAKISLKANKTPSYQLDDIIGESREIKDIKERVAKFSRSDSTILIQGESGTGKEIVARAIHGQSSRAQEYFVTINCGAIPEALLESELFGFEEGSFTGAKKGGKPGKFEIANGGTIFLDEIGDMPLHLQVKLLRVLQERTIDRIGSPFSVNVDVRVIAASNKDLEELARQNQFRWDLYYRLSVIPINIPPLRERGDDILILARHFLNLYAAKMDKDIRSFSRECEKLLLNYSWPGNVRELANAVEYALNMETSTVINEDNLPNKIRLNINKTEIYHHGLKSMEYEMLLDCLEKYGNTTEGKKKIAGYMGMSLSTLYRKLKNYNLEK